MFRHEFNKQYVEGETGISYYVKSDRVPLAFLVVLMMQFICVIIDRVLYLRRCMIAKIAFHILSVILIHLWLFLIVPMYTKRLIDCTSLWFFLYIIFRYYCNRKFNAQPAPIIFFIVKCMYYLYSAQQIRSGYPSRILGNYLTRSFSVVRLVILKMYVT